MKSFTVVCLFALVAVAFGKAAYTDRYDKINLGEILDNRRALIPYIKCVLGQTSMCTAEGKELKLHIKDALENNCASCTPAQRDGARRVLEHLINKEPEYWQQLVAKYDPDHKFTRRYENELKNIKH